MLNAIMAFFERRRVRLCKAGKHVLVFGYATPNWNERGGIRVRYSCDYCGEVVWKDE